MITDMTQKYIFPSICPVAVLTAKWLFSSMRSDMSLKVFWSIENSLTMRAAEARLCVPSHWAFSSRCLTKGGRRGHVRGLTSQHGEVCRTTARYGSALCG